MAAPSRSDNWIRPDGNGGVIIGTADPVPAEHVTQVIAWILEAAGQPEARALRQVVLNEVTNLVIGRQIADAGRLCDAEIREPHGNCGSYCGQGKTCHSAEAHAVLNRVLADLQKLKDVTR